MITIISNLIYRIFLIIIKQSPFWRRQNAEHFKVWKIYLKKKFHLILLVANRAGRTVRLRILSNPFLISEPHKKNSRLTHKYQMFFSKNRKQTSKLLYFYNRNLLFSPVKICIAKWSHSRILRGGEDNDDLYTTR